MWDSIWTWYGLGGAVMASAGALAWFFPPLRKYALAAALTAAAALSVYHKGNRDGSRRTQRKWDDAETKSADKGRKARDDARRDVAAGRVSDDKWFRD
ncbi:MAG TPA: hypothetical protein VNQ99_12220 [Xanthobacteraceae bacterium]|nr:hypothetical protein [Xanthobacteraceae bacterium]